MIAATIVFLLGLCGGSFINALVWRIYKQGTAKTKSQQYSILRGRSMCPKCEHVLSFLDLIPVIGWVNLRGKCRYCSKSISWQYPLVELISAILFLGSYLFWPSDLSVAVNCISFIVWLISLVGLIALIVYDVRWMLLPNRIIFPLLGLAVIGVGVESALSKSTEPITSALLGLLVGGGVFYFIFQLSAGRWIGGGDVKLGALLGILIGDPPKASLMLFTASVLGTLAILPLLGGKKIKLKTKIPFGPFLILAAILVKLYGQPAIDWYLEFL